MKKHFTLGFIACVLAASLAFQGIAQTQQRRPFGNMVVANSIWVVTNEDRVPLSITVTLFKGDAVVRSAVLASSNQPGNINERNGNASWLDVPAGPYELHVQADGYGKTIRRIAVGPEELNTFIIDKLSKADELMGARPTFAELDQRLKAVETENAALKARVATLEK